MSHITKCQRPDSVVIYNDYDNFRQRLENIPKTNRLLADLRKIVADAPVHKIIKGDIRERILERISQEEETQGFVDYITVSSSITFSLKYSMGLDALRKEALYNNIRKKDYPDCSDYLEGLTITSCDYKEVFNKYKDVPNVVYLIDPPYLSTDVGTYKMYWKLVDYLDVLKVLKGHSFVYFTSNKSSLIELCEWLGRNNGLGNPFENCIKKDVNFNTMNHSLTYTDTMLYKSIA